MPDGLTVNDILKLTDPDGFGGSEVSENELRYIAQGEDIVPFKQIERTIESNIGKDVSPDDIQAAAQALLDISKSSFDGDLDATVKFMREAVNENPEIGDVDFVEAVNSGAAAEFVNQTRAEQQAVDAARTSPPTEREPEQTDAARIEATTEAAPTESAPSDVSGEAGPTQADIEEMSPVTQPVDTPSTLDGLSERFRANESINESGFAEGIVVHRDMPNLDGDFGKSSSPVPMAAHIDDMKLAETSRILESVGMDSGTVLSDGKIEDYEFAQSVSKAGYQTIEAHPELNVEDFTQENHPEAYDKAMEFGKEMNLDLSDHPEIVIGLMAVEVTGNDAIMHAIMEAQRSMDAQAAPQPDMEALPAAVTEPAMADDNNGMKI